MQNNYTVRDEEHIRRVATTINNSARNLFTDNARQSTPDSAVVIPVHFLVSAAGIDVIAPTPSKVLTAAIVRRAIKPDTLAVISVSESFQASVTDPAMKHTAIPVRDLPNSQEKLIVMVETRSGLLLIIEQKIDRSDPLPKLGAPVTNEYDKATGRMAGWFA